MKIYVLVFSCFCSVIFVSYVWITDSVQITYNIMTYNTSYFTASEKTVKSPKQNTSYFTASLKTAKPHEQNASERTSTRGNDNPATISTKVIHGEFREASYEQQIYIYSVFYEFPSPSHSKAILFAVGSDAAAAKYRSEEQPIFHLFFSSDEKNHSTGSTLDTQQQHQQQHTTCNGTKRNTNPSRGHDFATVVFECVLPDDVIRPTSVSFSWPANSTQSGQFPVIYPDLAQPRRNFTVCYAVLFGGFNNADGLMQNIEFNMMMGAEHFFVYNKSIGPLVDALLQSYSAEGLVTVLPMPSTDRIVQHSYYHGQNVAIQDCAARNKHTSRYVALHDGDEFIYPLKHSSWNEMLTSLEEESSPDEQQQEPIAVFAFQNTFACNNMDPDQQPDWDNIIPNSSSSPSLSSSSSSSSSLQLSEHDKGFIKEHNVLLVLQRQGHNFTKFPLRQKTIYRPELVVQPSTHMKANRARLAPGVRTLRVSHEVAYLRHHRAGSRIFVFNPKECVLDYHSKPAGWYRDYLAALQGRWQRIKPASKEFSTRVPSGK